MRCSHCGTADGARRESEYEVTRCAPPAALNNNNGVLTCDGVPNAAGIPEGSYRNSCQGCMLDGSTLSCTHCGAADGRQRVATIELASCQPPGDIDNQDGALRCKR